MAGLVTNFMAVASIATTMHVHQEAASGLQLLAQSSVPDLVIVSKTDIPQAGDSFLTRVIKNIGLTDAFIKAGVERSHLSIALEAAQDLGDSEEHILENGNAVFLGFKDGQSYKAGEKTSDLQKRLSILEKDLKKGMIFYDPANGNGSIQSISGMERATDKFIPGSEKDRMALKLAHEAGHGTAGRIEGNADRDGFENYQNAVRAGQDLSLDYLHAFRAMRVLFDMKLNPNSDATADIHAYSGMNNFQWEKGDERLPDTLTREQYKQALNSLQSAVYEHIGEPLQSPERKLQALDRLFPSVVLSDENKAKIALAETPEEQIKIMNVAHLSMKQIDLYLDESKERRINLGYAAALEQPELAYNAALQIQPHIEQNGSPAEKLILKRYIEAAQRYQPDLFHVQEDDKKSNTPVTDRGITLAQSQSPAPAPLKITSP